MLGTEIFGFFLSSLLDLIEYSSKLAWSSKEIECYCRIIDSTTDLLAHIRLAFQTFGDSLAEKRRLWVEGEMQRTEIALANASSVVERRMGKSSLGQRLRSCEWVLKDKEAAETHKSVVLQCHSTLVVINLELAIVGGAQPWCGGILTAEPSLLPNPEARQTGHWSKDDLYVGNPYSPRMTPEQQRHLTFPMMRPSHRDSKGASPASATGLSAYLDFRARETEVEINSWLLKNAMQKARQVRQS